MANAINHWNVSAVRVLNIGGARRVYRDRSATLHYEAIDRLGVEIQYAKLQRVSPGMVPALMPSTDAATLAVAGGIERGE
jgi:hypothetical protein